MPLLWAETSIRSRETRRRSVTQKDCRVAANSTAPRPTRSVQACDGEPTDFALQPQRACDRKTKLLRQYHRQSNPAFDPERGRLFALAIRDIAARQSSTGSSER